MFVKGDAFGVGYVAVVLNTGSEVSGATHFKGHLWRWRDRTSRVNHRPKTTGPAPRRASWALIERCRKRPLKLLFSATFLTGTETYAVNTTFKSIHLRKERVDPIAPEFRVGGCRLLGIKPPPAAFLSRPTVQGMYSGPTSYQRVHSACVQC